MIAIEEAIDKIKSVIYPVQEIEGIDIECALGRILGEDLLSHVNQPPFARSPLDGYAVLAEDTVGTTKENPVKLKVVDCVYAGEYLERKLQNKEAVRIMTGAPVPQGANTVIRQEDTDTFQENGEEFVQIYQEQKAFENYCFPGEDFQEGDCILKKGERMDSIRIGLAAAMGYKKIPVLRNIRAAVITTGSELLDPGEKLEKGKIYNSNLFLLSARLEEMGVKVSDKISVVDEMKSISEEIKKMKDKVDLLILTGGVSVGEKDLTEAVLKALNADILFHGVKMKPGSPMLAAMAGNTVVLGLSGNPFAALASLEIFLKPVLHKLSGSDWYQSDKRLAIAGSEYPKTCKNPRFVRGKWQDGVVILPEKHASGVLNSMKECNCLVEISAGKKGIRKGEKVCVKML